MAVIAFLLVSIAVIWIIVNDRLAREQVKLLFKWPLVLFVVAIVLLVLARLIR